MGVRDHTFMRSSRWGERGGGPVKNVKNSDGSGWLQGGRGRGFTEIKCPEL